MIVDTMTHAEVYEELAKEREAVTTWWRNNIKAQRRRVLKSTRFPLFLWFDYTSARKNRYLFFAYIFDKHMKRYLAGVAVLSYGRDGLTIYTNWLGKYRLINPMVIIPHAWKRYAERMGLHLSDKELVKHFFTNNPFGKDNRSQKVASRSVRYNGKEHLFNCVEEGILLGYEEGDLFIAKTFITYDMCGGLQQLEFCESKMQIPPDNKEFERARRYHLEQIYNDYNLFLI